MKDILIFSNKLTNELIENGYNIKRVEFNKKQDSKETVFFFANTEQIRQFLEKEKGIIVK